MTNDIAVGDIVQITSSEHHWYPALVVVTEVKAWGIQGYTVIVTNGPEANFKAYIRLSRETYERVGAAKVVAA